MGGHVLQRRMLLGSLLGLALVLLAHGVMAQTSEASPLRDDALDDGVTAELGNVWISDDDGSSYFEITLRVEAFDTDPVTGRPTTTYPAYETPYGVEFTDDARGIRYMAAAFLYNYAPYSCCTSGSPLPPEYYLFVGTTDATGAGEHDWCRVGVLSGSVGVDSITMQVEYAMLEYDSVPDLAYVDSAWVTGGVHSQFFGGGDCDATLLETGAPAGPCDMLDEWDAHYKPHVGPANIDWVPGTGVAGDETDGPVSAVYFLSNSTSCSGSGGTLNVTAGGPYDTQTFKPVATAGSALGGVPTYICRWTAAAPEVSFFDPSDCGSPVTASRAGTYNLTLQVTDQVGAWGIDWAQLNVTDGDTPDEPDGPTSGPAEHTSSDADAPNKASSSGGSRRQVRIAAADSDLDGVPDDEDGCATLHDDQEDLDGDGIGDACDADMDNDGVENGLDNCPRTPNPLQHDGNRDGRGDACVPDTDGDGLVDDVDNCVDVPNPHQVDLDRDGLGNLCDEDADGDGVPNDDEAKGFALDPWESKDNDGDGIGDRTDPDDDDDLYPDIVELAAGSDPFDKYSIPDAGSIDVHGAPEQGASIGGLGSIGLLVALAILGVVLFLLLRPRDA